MTQLISLRLYFHHSERVPERVADRVTGRARPTSFWHRVSRPSLASHLLRHAKEAGIEQALLHRVHAGYLKGDRLHHEHVEIAHHRFPHCIELIDLDVKVRDFWRTHGKGLDNVRAIFLPCELPMQAT